MRNTRSTCSPTSTPRWASATCTSTTAARCNGLIPTFTPLAEPFTDHYVEGWSEIVRQVTGDATFYFIPTRELPLSGPPRTLGIPQSVYDTAQPAARVLIGAGYDRSVPLGERAPAQLSPSIDPITFALEFGQGSTPGRRHAFALIGVQPRRCGTEKPADSGGIVSRPAGRAALPRGRAGTQRRCQSDHRRPGFGTTGRSGYRNHVAAHRDPATSPPDPRTDRATR